MDNTAFRILTKISEQDDVTITTPADGQGLRYNAATSKWINSTGVSGSIAESQVTNLVSDLAGKAASTHTHLAADVTDFSTAADARITAQKAQLNGLATLDGAGLVPTSQLPSYVDDVVEYANLAAFPATGESGKIYVAIDTLRTYRWSSTVYAEVSPSAVTQVNGSTGAVTVSTTSIGAATASALTSHAALTTAHGATTSATNNSIVKRDGSAGIAASVGTLDRLSLNGEIFLTSYAGIAVFDDGSGGFSTEGQVVDLKAAAVDCSVLKTRDGKIVSSSGLAIRNGADDAYQDVHMAALTATNAGCDAFGCNGNVDICAGLFGVYDGITITIGFSATEIGFYGTSPTTRPNVDTSGSTATTQSNLIAALVALGLITTTP